MPLVLGLATVPRSNPPTLGGQPDGASVDTTTGLTVSWGYNPAQPGNTQTGWYFEREILGQGVWLWWDDTNQVWSTTAVLNDGPASSVTFGPGMWPTGQDYAWSVSTVDQGGQSPYATPFALAAVPSASAVITAPVGTIAQCDPTAEWSSQWPLGYQQAGYELVVEQGTQPGATAPGTGTVLWDSGVIASSAQSGPLGIELPQGQLTLWHQATGTNGMLTEWTYSEPLVQIQGFAQPVLTATPGDDPVTGMPMVTLKTTFDTSMYQLPNGYRRSIRVRVSYTDDGGKHWYRVRNTGQNPNPYWFSEQLTGSVTMIDYESTPGVSRTYHAEVTAYNIYVGREGSPLVTPDSFDPILGGGPVPIPLPQGSVTEWSTQVEATTIAEYWVLKHTSNPALSVALHLDRNTDLQAVRSSRQQVVWPIGAEAPIILDDALGLPAITVPAIFLTQAEYEQFIDLYETKDIFLFQGPAPVQWYVRIGDTTNDSLNLKSVRQAGSKQAFIRSVTFTLQAVAAAGSAYIVPGTEASS